MFTYISCHVNEEGGAKVDFSIIKLINLHGTFRQSLKQQQEGQRCPKRRVAQVAIRLATAVIKFRNKERNVRSPS